MGWIYQITNLITGQVYIGKTTSTPEMRFSQHCKNSKTKTTYLYRSMQAHGIENFTVVGIEECDDADLNNLESAWIQKKNSVAPNGFNMTLGGDGGDTSHSPNYQKAIAARNSFGDKNPNYGNTGSKHPKHGISPSPEVLQRQVEGMKKSWSENVVRKQKLSNKMKGESNPQFGKKPKNSVPILINGIQYRSLTEAAKALNTTIHSIKKLGQK